jgi:energy-coupling factor transport system ATP-binding protein
MIHVDNISLDFPGEDNNFRRVLKDISLSIKEGESIAIMGANGSGKTTLVRCLNGLLLPNKGSVSVDGYDTREPQSLLPLRRRIGMVFQNPDNQIVSTTVEREIAFGLENIGMPFDEMHAVVEEMLSRFDLMKYRNRSPHYLSGGEKQKLALAAVLAMRPQYLVLDEPTSLLDPHGRNEILSIVKELHLPQNNSSPSPITTLLVTQFPEESLIARRLIILHKGEIVMDDEPEAIFEKMEELQKIGLQPPVRHRVRRLLAEYAARVAGFQSATNETFQ